MAGPMLITDSDISGVLKNVYESFRINAFPKLTPLLANVKKATPGGPERMTWGGNGVYFDVMLTRPTGMTASTSGYFPPHSQVTEKQANLGIKRTYVTREIDSLAISGTQEKDAAFVNLARKIVQEALDAAQLGQQEVLHGNALGIKALVSSRTSDTEYVAYRPYGVTGAGQGGLLLDVGMYVAILDASDSFVTVLGRGTIATVSNSGDNCTFTIDSISGVASGDAIVAATSSDTSYNAFPNGLINLTNRGAGYTSVQGIDAATYARWDATRYTAGTDTDDANQPTEMDVWKLATQIANRSGKDAKMKPGEFLMLTTPGVERKLAESFLGQRRWDAEVNPTLKGGFKAVQICGINLVSDYWCPAGTLYMLHLPSLTWVDRQDWIKLQYEDSGPWRFIAGRDAYQVNFGAYWNFGMLQRNALGSIISYTDADRFTHVL